MAKGIRHAFLGYAAKCFWNPEWAYLGAVSADAITPGLFEAGFESPWCPSGSDWLEGEEYSNTSFDLYTEVNAKYRMACPDFGLNTETERNSCVRGVNSGPLWMGMRPAPSSLIDVSAELEGEKVRATMTVGYASIRDASSQGSCGTAKALMGLPSGLSTPPVLDDVVRGSLFFLDATGRLLDSSGAVLDAAPSCASDPPALAGPDPLDSRVEVLPLMERRTSSNIFATVRVSGVVPDGARFVGVSVRMPANSYPFNPEPVMSTVTFERRLAADPELTDAFPETAPTSVPLATSARRCDDAAWFGALALTGTDCLVDFAGGAP